MDLQRGWGLTESDCYGPQVRHLEKIAAGLLLDF